MYHMEKFQNKYRISSARLPSWDYRANAAYFITICTEHRTHYFGEIMDGVVYMNDIGRIVESEWMRTAAIRPDMHLELDIMTVMPNHFHAIVVIGDNAYNDDGSIDGCFAGGDAKHRVSTSEPLNRFGPQYKNLASIVRGLKSSVTTQARRIHADFHWQSGFHEHIIRSTESFHKIQTYIANNLLTWQDDMFYCDDLHPVRF